MKYLRNFLNESISIEKDIKEILSKYHKIKYPDYKSEFEPKGGYPFLIKENIKKFLIKLDSIRKEMHNLIMNIDDKTDISDSLYDELEKGYNIINKEYDGYEEYSDILDEYIKTEDRLNELYKILSK